MKNLFEALHDRVISKDIDQDSSDPKDISRQAQSAERHNFGVHLVALSLTKMGDALLDIKLVLPWLLTAVGAPQMFVAMLVPLRESLALLPQFFMAAWTQSYSIRKTLWSAGCVAQGISVVGIAVTPWFLSGTQAGVAVLILLTLFSLSRCLCSIAIKDVQGRTIDKQHRGRVSGVATSIAGIAAIAFAVSLLLGWLSKESSIALSVLLSVAASGWLIAALVYVQVREYPGEKQEKPQSIRSRVGEYGALLREHPLPLFLLVRGLLISTALVAPFYVVLANQNSEGNISALGLLLLFAGIANFVSGWFWGKLSDLSSRRVLSLTGFMAFALATAVFISNQQQWALSSNYYWYGGILFLLYITHAGVRLGRSTYLIDMAKEHNRTQLVALSNTIIGLVLLAAGAVIALWSNDAAHNIILGLGLSSLLAAVLALRLPEVSRA